MRSFTSGTTEMSPPRRSALKRIVLGMAGLLAATGADTVAVRADDQEVTVSGSGVNVKEMPGVDGKPVELRESFAADPFYAQCIIEDNPAAFTMDTFSMGKVTVSAHSFFMAMYANEIHLTGVTQGSGGAHTATLAGTLECSTQAGVATTTVGSRTNIEVADFVIEATDGGTGGGNDSFAFHVTFDPDRAPLNYSIFGPNPTFTGKMLAGKVSIGAPVTISVS